MLLVVLAAFALASAALADTRIEKTLKLEPGGRFVLESDQGSVTVNGTSSSGAKVVITSNRDDLQSIFDFSFAGDSGEARVTARRKYRFDWQNHVSLHYEVEVPTKTRVNIKTGGGSIETFRLRGDADLNTSGGSIKVSGVAGHLEAHTSGGSIHLQEVEGDAGISTSGGGIEVASLEGALRAHTSGGPIRIERVTGEVEAKTSGGSVHVNFGRGNAHGGDVETSGGSIEVELDPAANLDIDASTSGGSVSSDLPIRVVGTISSSSLHGSLGSGGPRLRLHTSGGSIRIRAL
jgi:DUF4097 and DUF4098 domain-containing protein YvlB